MTEEELEDFYEKHYKSVIQCKVDALESVDKMDLPKTVVISDDSFSGLGPKTRIRACFRLKRLREEYEDKLPYLIGLSLREAWFSLFAGVHYLALTSDDEVLVSSDYVKNFVTAKSYGEIEEFSGGFYSYHFVDLAKGYGEIEGFAVTLYNQLSEFTESSQQATFRVGTPFEECLPLFDILEAVALYWLTVAATSCRAGDVEEAFDWISEAQVALTLANGSYMWDEGVKFERELAVRGLASAAAAARTDLAKVAAQARHAENRSMKADVFAWLDTNMGSFNSMDAAALAITGQQPIVFRTARAWVGDWKKQRSAGTP